MVCVIVPDELVRELYVRTGPGVVKFCFQPIRSTEKFGIGLPTESSTINLTVGSPLIETEQLLTPQPITIHKNKRLTVSWLNDLITAFIVS